MTVQLESEFLSYLAAYPLSQDGKLPPMNELAEKLGMSVSKLREQIEVARTLGWVEVRPRTGIEAKPFSATAPISVTMRYALARDRQYFDQIEELREVIEASYWHRAVEALRPGDKERLQELVDRAWQMLEGDPIQIPHEEHRELHLTIFSRLDNLFVKGFLQAYWDAYESVGLNVFTDYPYLETVWNYHQVMVESILGGETEKGYQALVEHFGILLRRPGAARPAAGTLNELNLITQDVGSKQR